jgi:hypothetical protein
MSCNVPMHISFSALTLSSLFVCEGAWWEVDLGQDVDVTKVIVYNRLDCCSERLSKSEVLLLDEGHTTLKTFAIEDAHGVDFFEFNVVW